MLIWYNLDPIQTKIKAYAFSFWLKVLIETLFVRFIKMKKSFEASPVYPQPTLLKRPTDPYD